jgi:hypothetical protein
MIASFGVVQDVQNVQSVQTVLIVQEVQIVQAVLSLPMHAIHSPAFVRLLYLDNNFKPPVISRSVWYRGIRREAAMKQLWFRLIVGVLILAGLALPVAAQTPKRGGRF